MSDKKKTIDELKQQVVHFIHERNWRQFHDAKNMSINISVEAAELSELFMWARDKKEINTVIKEKRTQVEHELADILFGVLAFADEYDIDMSTALEKKIIHNAQKYPVKLCKGQNKKYDEY